MNTYISFLLAFTLSLLLAPKTQGLEPVDYANASHWMYTPKNTNQPVDVFYLYPTAWTPTANDGLICDIDNPSMLAGAKNAYGNTATAFEPLANVYAPYYRQADAAASLSLSPDEREALLRNGPAVDAIAAFEYYLEHHNNGRPFILAGHSQGSNTLLYLMDTYLKEHPEVQSRMVASYTVGYSVTQQYLNKNPQLTFGSGPADTGVILSWNTESGNVTGPNPVVEPGTLAINPLTWSTGTEQAGVELNLGSILVNNMQAVTDSNGNPIIVDGFANARVDPDRGVVICDNVAESDFSIPGFPPGVFHGSDYPFYYVNIMMNALLRSSVYLSREQAAMYPSAMLEAANAARAFSKRLPVSFDPNRAHVDECQTRFGDDTQEFPSEYLQEQPGGFSIFASPFGTWTRRDSRANDSGYDVNGGGITVGGMRSNGRFQYGMAAGYHAQRQKMKEFNGRIDADMVQASLFGGARFGNVFVDAAAGYSHAWNTSERHVVFPGFADWKHKADFGQDIWSGKLDIGYVTEIGSTRIIPGLGLDITHVRTATIREEGAATALYLDKSRYTSIELPVSVRLDRQFRGRGKTVLTPHITAAWIPEVNGNKPSTSARFISQPSAGSFSAKYGLPGRMRGRVATGLRADTGKNMSFMIDYSLDFARSRRLHEVSASFSLGF